MPDLRQQFAEILEDSVKRIKPEVAFTWRKMFGGAGYYADGVIFAAEFSETTIALKLDDADRIALLSIEGAQQGMMDAYIELPPDYLKQEHLLDEWVAKSITYVASLPPKKKKSKQ